MLVWLVVCPYIWCTGASSWVVTHHSPNVSPPPPHDPEKDKRLQMMAGCRYCLLKDLVCVTMYKNMLRIRNWFLPFEAYLFCYIFYILVLYNYIIGLCSSRTRTIFLLEELVWTLFLLVRKNISCRVERMRLSLLLIIHSFILTTETCITLPYLYYYFGTCHTKIPFNLQ